MLYGTLAEPVTCSIWICGKATGTPATRPGRTTGNDQAGGGSLSGGARADSGYYDQKLVQICAARGVEFFIVAKKHANVMKAVHALPASAWKPFQANELSRGGRSGRRRKRRRTLKRKITIERRPKSWFKGKPEIASMVCPDSWSEPYRVIKRTPIIDKDDKQLYLDDGMRKYAYWIVVTNSTRSNTAVLRIAQGRGNQENLIKDFKHGLGLSHVPTGFLAANRAYFLIAALAWNLKPGC